MSIETFRKRYRDGIEYIYKHDPFLFPISKEVKNNRLWISNDASYSQLMGLSILSHLPQLAVLYDGVSPSNEMVIPFQFNQSHLGWYFMYGRTKTYRFTYMFMRCSVSPKERGPDEVLYMTIFGIDTGNGWVMLPRNAGPAKYIQTPQGVHITYQSDDIQNTLIIENNSILNTIQYKEDTYVLTLTGETQHLNGKMGCVPVCFGGIGSSYWSYTSAVVHIDVNDKTEVDGSGWFDHQWSNFGIPKGFFNQLLYAWDMSSNPIHLNTPWLWYTIQLDSNIQYMMVQPVKNELIPLTTQTSFTSSNGVRYNKDKVTYKMKYTLNIKKVKKVGVYTFPIEIEVHIDGKVYTLSSVGDDSYTVHMPTGLNWEGVADVYEEEKKVGSGFIEANNLLQDKIYASNSLSILNIV